MLLFGNILAIIAIATLLPVAFTATYYLILACYSLLPECDTQINPSKTPAKFAVTLYARNSEEKTVEAVKRLIEGMDYNRSKFEIVVIADSCDDSTAYIASFNGAKVLERRNEWKIGFAFAMEWAIPILLDDGFDAILALDMDSVPLSKALKHLNDAISAGYVAAQLPLISTDDRGFLAGIADAARNRINPAGRSKAGFSCDLQSVGFCLTKELLSKTPFVAIEADNIHEYSSKLILQDTPVAFISKTTVLLNRPLNPEFKTGNKGQKTDNELASFGKLIKSAIKGNSTAFERICGILALKAKTLCFALIVEMFTGVVLLFSGSSFTQYASLLPYGRFIIIISMIASVALCFHLTRSIFAWYSDFILKKAVNY
jgi:glycosyltransferase involved in cell wall biosynthesis